ncbi:MAG: universal stress protein [Nitrospirales bacterium]|nr:universal stress protein [Nitrospirales bacterium]
MKILVAIDETDYSIRLVQYVGALLRETPHARVTLFHVLRPMPRKLLEHGGSESPVVEGQLQNALKKEQTEWIRSQQEEECPYLLKARDALGKAGFPLDRVELKFGHEDGIAQNILEEAYGGGFSTVAVGRYGTSRTKRLFGGGVTDQLLREATGLAVWVVE